MGKKKTTTDSGSGSTKALTTVAMAGGVFLLRKVLATTWTKVTGKVPPTDLTDPRVTLVEALAWSVATGIVIETARYFVLHSAASKSVAEAGTEER